MHKRVSQAGIYVVGLALASASLGGCSSLTSSQWAQWKPPPLEMPVASNTRKAQELELPPHEAARACLKTAELLEQNGHEIEAIYQYERARHYDPRLTHVARRLAVLYDRQGDHARAAHEYKKALELEPNNVELLNDYGYFQYQRGDWQEAEKWLRKALHVNPRYERAWVNLGMTLAMQGRYAESYEAFVKAVTPAQAHANLGFLLTTQGKWEEAKAAYRKALSLEPGLQIAAGALAKLEEAERMPPKPREQNANPLLQKPGTSLPSRNRPEPGRAHPGDRRGKSTAEMPRPGNLVRPVSHDSTHAPSEQAAPPVGAAADISFE
ncbi:MAG: hypothetical protein C4297_10435 [Gemmataceae bacterium]